MLPLKVFTCTFRSYTRLAVANLLAHNNKSQICYCGQISLLSAAFDNLTPLGGNIYFAGDGTQGGCFLESALQEANEK